MFKNVYKLPRNIVSFLLAASLAVCLPVQVFANSPKVSVIIPVYNTAAYLEKCLTSVVNQTLKDIEIICINDGSTDSSLEILQSFAAKDPRIRIIDQPNGGASRARNAGLDAATGEYIGFVDSDDYIKSKTYEIAYKCAKGFADLVAWGVLDFFEYGYIGRYHGPCRMEYWQGDAPRYFLSGSFERSVWNNIYRAQIIKANNIKFKEDAYQEDFFFNIDVTPYVVNALTVPKAMYYYLQRPTGLCRTTSLKVKLTTEKNLLERFAQTWKRPELAQWRGEANEYLKQWITRAVEWFMQSPTDDIQEICEGLREYGLHAFD